MTIATIAEVKCLIKEALALESDKHLSSVRQFNATTNTIPLVMSDGTVLNLDMSAVIAAAGGMQKDIHVVAWGDYDKATNTGYLTMSNGTKVPVDMTQVIADAIASIVFPEVPEGFDCAAIGELPTRPYISGDSILVLLILQLYTTSATCKCRRCQIIPIKSVTSVKGRGYL